jgi:asparaginyl-tRNA synthetase
LPSARRRPAISRLENFIAAPFERIDHTEAVDILKKSGQKFDYPVECHDLQTEHERYLTEKHVGRPSSS